MSWVVKDSSLKRAGERGRVGGKGKGSGGGGGKEPRGIVELP